MFYYPGRGVYAVTAHCRENDDDSAVERAVYDLLDTISQRKPPIATVHFQFSATGGTVPPVYAFTEVVRAVAQWVSRQRCDNPLRSAVLYVPGEVEWYLTAGRVDIRELLSSKFIRFWIVVISRDSLEPIRRAMHCAPSTPMADVLKEVGVLVDSHDWFVSVCPSPRWQESDPRVIEDGGYLKRTAHYVKEFNIVQVGIVFGSVLILERCSGRIHKQKEPLPQ